MSIRALVGRRRHTSPRLLGLSVATLLFVTSIPAAAAASPTPPPAATPSSVPTSVPTVTPSATPTTTPTPASSGAPQTPAAVPARVKATSQPKSSADPVKEKIATLLTQGASGATAAKVQAHDLVKVQAKAQTAAKAPTPLKKAVPARLALSPSNVSIELGKSQRFLAIGYGADGKFLGDVDSSASFTIDGAACPQGTCVAAHAGDLEVVGVVGTATGRATLHVTAPAKATDAAAVPPSSSSPATSSASPSPASSNAASPNTTLVNVSGRILDGSGAGVANATVDLYIPSWGGSQEVHTGSTGAFTFNPVPPGNCTLSIVPQSSTLLHGYYLAGAPGNFTYTQAQAGTIVVGATDVTGIIVTVPAGVIVSGRVVNASGVGLSGIEVDATSSTYYGSNLSDGSGNYAIGVVAGTSVKVRFSGSLVYADEYLSASGFTPHFSSAKSFAVGNDPLSIPDMTLPLRVHISGRVLDSSGHGISGVFAEAYGSDLSGVGTNTDATGAYSLAVDPNVDLILAFDDYSNLHVSGYLQNGSFALIQPASSISIGAADLTGVNVTLPLGVRISGRVTDKDGKPVVNETVFPFLGAPGYGGQQLVGQADGTGADGSYTVTVPANASYALEFFDGGGFYAMGYYRSKGSVVSPSTASLIPVGESDVSGIDVVLTHYATVTGHVVDQNGAPRSGVTVSAVLDGYGSSATSNAQGVYSLRIAAGYTYELAFSYSQSGSLDVGYYAEGASGRFTALAEDASAVLVPDAGISGLDVTLPDFYRISGNLIDPDLHHLAGIEVFVLDPDNLSVYVDATTDATGTWSGRVLAGTYFLYYYDSTHTYASGYYGNVLGGIVSSPSEAQLILISTHDANFGFELPFATHIRGHVTSGGSPVAGLEVDVYEAGSGLLWDFATTDSNGAYSILAYPMVEYVVGTWDESLRYPNGYWTETDFAPDFTQDRTLAGMVIVTTSDLTVDIPLPIAHEVSGTVIDSAGSGVQGIEVWVFNTLGDPLMTIAETDQYGYYAVLVLSGSYYIAFEDPRGVLATGYWDGDGFTYDPDKMALVAVTADVAHLDVQIPSIPDAPTGAHAVRGDGSATVTWAAPAKDGGAEITSYVVYSLVDNNYCEWTSGPLTCTVTELTNGTPYAFLVFAMNIAGYGPDSEPSNTVAPAGLPRAPSGVTATPGVGSAAVSWAAAAANGTAVTAYAVTSSPASAGCTTSGATTCTVTGLTPNIGYAFQVRATNGVGDGPLSDPSGSVVPISGATYNPVTPARVLDSRRGLGAGTFHSRQKQTVLIANGSSGVPANAIAVTGNVTITGQTRTGYVTVAPSLTSWVEPPTSTINFPVGDNRANGVTVPLSGGRLDFMYWSGGSADTAHVIFDVTGYFASDTSGAMYHTVTPARVLDSRRGLGAATFHSRQKQTVVIANGSSGVPADAVAVTGNVTITGQTRTGYVTVAPSLTSGAEPPTSTINFPVKDNRANGVTVPLSGGHLDFMYWSASGADTVQVIFDVTGYFARDNTGSTYHAVAPVRVLDSRKGIGAGAFHSRQAQTVSIANGWSGVPGDAVAVTGNVTITGQTRNGYATVAPALTSWVEPPTSTINFPLGDNRANGITVPLSGGHLDFMYWSGNAADTSHVIFDATGYFSR